MKILSLIQKCSSFIRTYGFAKGLRVIYWGILNNLPQFIGRPILFRRLGKVENSIYKIIGDKIASFQVEDDQRVYNPMRGGNLGMLASRRKEYARSVQDLFECFAKTCKWT